MGQAFAEGGAREPLARAFYSELGAVLVDNRPGTGGAFGTASVAGAAPGPCACSDP